MCPGTRRLSTARLASPGEGVCSSVGPVRKNRLQVCRSTTELQRLAPLTGIEPATSSFSLVADERADFQLSGSSSQTAYRTSSQKPEWGQPDAKAHDEGASRESNPRCSRQDSNLHRLSTPGLSRVAMPFAYASDVARESARRESNSAGPLIRRPGSTGATCGQVGHLRVERSASSLSESSGQPARHDPNTHFWAVLVVPNGTGAN